MNIVKRLKPKLNYLSELKAYYVSSNIIKSDCAMN